jgi:hypothetical protein
MRLAQGDKIRSKLNGAVYLVKAVKNTSVVVESEQGLKQEWNMKQLRLIFQKIEGNKLFDL